MFFVFFLCVFSFGFFFSFLLECKSMTVCCFGFVYSFLLVDISTSFGENVYANVSLLRNRKLNVISQSGWIILHSTISCKIDFLFAR